jgi:hypothetical protein
MPSEYLQGLLKKLREEIPLSQPELDYLIQHSRLTEKGKQALRGIGVSPSDKDDLLALFDLFGAQAEAGTLKH